MRFLAVISVLFKITIMISIGYAGQLLAKEDAAPDLLDVTNHLMESAVVATDFFYLVYVILGTAFVTASVIKFFERRVNPLGVRISQIVFLLVAGLFMLVMPYLVNHSQSELQSAVFPALFGS